MSEPILRGDLGLIGLFDLGQLLLLNRATGCLSIRNGPDKAFLYFEEGRLVNAVDEELHQGETAAYQVFSWREGSFEFRAERPMGAVTIQGSTDSILLEAARRIDESRLDESTGPPEEQRLRDRRAALEGLRDAFQRAAGDPRPMSVMEAPALLLAELKESGDRLVFRPARPTRLRQSGQWIEPEGTPLVASAYRELRSRLLEQCVALVEEGRDTPVAFHLYSDHGAFEVNLVGTGADEAVWLRRVALPPRDPAQLQGDMDALIEAMVGSPGLTLVGGNDLATTRTLLATLVSSLAAAENGTVLIASDDTTFRWIEWAGVVLRVSPESFRHALRAIEPDVVVLDPGVPRRHVSLSDLSSVPRIVAGAVAADAGSLPTRWLAAIAPRLSRSARASLATLAWTLVVASDNPRGAPSYRVFALSPAQRKLALAGRTHTLSGTLVEGESPAHVG
jgi:hypothetical protein